MSFTKWFCSGVTLSPVVPTNSIPVPLCPECGKHAARGSRFPGQRKENHD